MKFKDGFLFGCGVLLAAFIILFIVGNTFAASGSSTGVNLSEYTGTINANGNGYVYVEPDIAKITVGVVTEASTSTQAMADNANQMDQVVKAIKKAGIADRDIQTSRVSVEPEYASEVRDYVSSYYYPAKQNISGYKATNTMTITVRDTSKLGPVIDAAYNSGSNEIRGVVFMLSEDLQAQVYKQALQAAVLEATDKAKTMATAAGVTDYKLKTLTESGAYYPVYYDSYATNGITKSEAAPTPVSPGEQKVQATVSMTYVFIPQ